MGSAFGKRRHVSEASVIQCNNVLEKAAHSLGEASRCLYAACHEADEAESSAKFCTFRENARKHAAVFADFLLQVSESVVAAMKTFMNYYLTQEYDDWNENIGAIGVEAHAYATVCGSLKIAYQHLLGDFKRLAQEHRNQSQQNTPGRKSTAALYHAFISSRPDIKSPESRINAFKEDILRQHIADVEAVAIACIEEYLIPAITNFIEALRSLAGFFAGLASDVKEFGGKGKEAHTRGKLVHYNLLRTMGNGVQEKCTQFIECLPNFNANIFLCGTTYDAFVKNWVDENMDGIDKEYLKALWQLNGNSVQQAVDNVADNFIAQRERQAALAIHNISSNVDTGVPLTSEAIINASQPAPDEAPAHFAPGILAAVNSSAPQSSAPQ